MKKAFFNQFNKEQVQVTGYVNEIGRVYRYAFHVGRFSFAVNGTEHGDDITIQYPTYRETLRLVPIYLHNDEELQTFIYRLLEVSDYIDGKHASQPKQTTVDPLPSSIPDLQSFEEECRKRGALTFENVERFLCSGHDEEEYQADKPYLLFYEDLFGYYYAQVNNIDSEYSHHVYPNAPHVSLKNYSIHIHDQQIIVDFVVTNHKDVHFHFPVHAYDKRHTRVQTLENMEELKAYCDRLFQQAFEKATSTGLSLYSYHLIEQMSKDSNNDRFKRYHTLYNDEPKKQDDTEYERIWIDEDHPAFLYKQYPKWDDSDDLPF